MSLLTAFEKNYAFTKKEKDFLDILPVDVYEEIVYGFKAIFNIKEGNTICLNSFIEEIAETIICKFYSEELEKYSILNLVSESLGEYVECGYMTLSDIAKKVLVTQLTDVINLTQNEFYHNVFKEWYQENTANRTFPYPEGKISNYVSNTDGDENIFVFVSGIKKILKKTVPSKKLVIEFELLNNDTVENIIDLLNTRYDNESEINIIGVHN